MSEPLKDLEAYITNVPHGEFSVNLKTHKNKITTFDVNAQEKVQYKTTEQAMAQLLQLIKEYKDAKFNGEMTFTITFKDGEINMVIRQGFRRFHY